MVEGTPGTKIYTPRGTCVGSIQNSGKTKIELPSDGYYAYLLSKDEKADVFVPFALDYKKCSRTGVKALETVGIGLTAVGLGTMIAGTVGIALDSEDKTASLMFGAGAGVAGLGALIGCPANNKMEQTSYDWNFKYLDKQSTNNDLSFTKPVLASAKKKTVTKTKSLKETKNNQVSEKSTKTFKNYSAQLEGTYVGSGTLTLNGKVIERYTNALISIERINNETVCVNVEEGGAFFFDDCSNYKIKKTKSGYTLTHNEISKAMITAKKNGQIDYSHPRVNIDGTIYTLKLTAKKQ